jgi:hypothetical protein
MTIMDAGEEPTDADLKKMGLINEDLQKVRQRIRTEGSEDEGVGMTLGPGKYDDLCSYVRKQVGITDDGGGGVMLIVLGGNRGNGFACQADIRTTLSLPDLLENIPRATGCARSAQAVTACRRDGGSIERWRCRSPERPAGSLALRRTYPRPRRRCAALRPR